MYSFIPNYNQETNNTFKLILDDGTNSRIVFINLFKINKYWYLDVLDEEKNYIYAGRRILSYVDIFEVLRNRNLDFPSLKLMALPVNVQGFKKEFIEDVPGVLQDLLVIK